MVSISEISSFFFLEKSCICENGGTCIGEGFETKCICKPGFGGLKCQGNFINFVQVYMQTSLLDRQSTLDGIPALSHKNSPKPPNCWKEMGTGRS